MLTYTRKKIVSIPSDIHIMYTHKNKCTTVNVTSSKFHTDLIVLWCAVHNANHLLFYQIVDGLIWKSCGCKKHFVATFHLCFVLRHQARAVGKHRVLVLLVRQYGILTNNNAAIQYQRAFWNPVILLPNQNVIKSIVKTMTMEQRDRISRSCALSDITLFAIVKSRTFWILFVC